MKLYKFYRHSEIEELEEVRLLRRIKNNEVLEPHIHSVRVETCFYIEVNDKMISEDEIFFELNGYETLKRLLADNWIVDGLSTSSKYRNEIKDYIIEVGPRPNFTTPFSTNCVSILEALKISYITRIEKAKRYVFKYPKNEEQKNEVKKIICDPMTQRCYFDSLSELTLPREPPAPWYYIPVHESGKEALNIASKKLGLGFDDLELDYYFELFTQIIKKNPTSVELFDLAQSNSEHSRHWFFKGIYVIDGKVMEKSLLQMVMDTNPDPADDMPETNSVIKFSDNSSCIVGYPVNNLVRNDVLNCGYYKGANVVKDIIFTAETHNFPTGVEPFSGATTGTGGRIRDVQAVGRGGCVVAGTAGYCVGNLRIPGFIRKWEDNDVYPKNFASPLDILIEASNGASDYGNKFGEPVISGFTRTFGMNHVNIGGRREWIKPIMFSAGIGTLDHKYVNKNAPETGDLLVKIGGPAYRIGVGGGAASSAAVQGADEEDERNVGAVQRGDPEMGQKLNRVIRGCLELQFGNPCESFDNPIQTIHDQGAGGNANVIKEIVENQGADVFVEDFSVGDDTLSMLELWAAEYQESNALVVKENEYKYIKSIADRERCPIDSVGIITDNCKVTLIENKKHLERKHPVELHLYDVLVNMQRKIFQFKTEKVADPVGLHINTYLSIEEALKMVLNLPSVGSKRFLTSKVDRSVTGLIAQQQCVGPLQLPLADVAVVALDYFSKVGSATSIGEQPIKMLINPRSGAKLTVIEALTNLCSCYIESLEKVKCSANWMWPAKLPGEGAAMYEACESMCAIMKDLKIGVDGGKDSLSMAARVKNKGKESTVKAPGSLVISAYAPVPDIYQVVTPDLKTGNYKKESEEGVLYLIKPAYCYNRIGGSALAQVLKETGVDCPDLTGIQTQKFVQCFNCIQKLIAGKYIQSLHDISDGGLITCLVEMAISGYSGISVTLPKIFEGTVDTVDTVDPCLRSAFNEEPGWVLEAFKSDTEVLKIISEFGLQEECMILGRVDKIGANSRIVVRHDDKTVLDVAVKDALGWWDEISVELEKQQIGVKLAECEKETMTNRTPKNFVPNFSWNNNHIENPKPSINDRDPKVAVVREEGSNGDREMVAALYAVGFTVYDVTMSDLINNSTLNLNMFKGLVFPGGFSYGDVLGSANGWAATILESPTMKRRFDAFKSDPLTFVLGICNGCQLMARLSWINIDEDHNKPTQIKLFPNDSGRFECRWVNVKIPASNSIFFSGMSESILGVWSAHGEGKFAYKRQETYGLLKEKGRIALQYVDDNGLPTETYPFNPNGSEDGVAAISSACGRFLAMMPHPERSFFGYQCPFTYRSEGLSPWRKMFTNVYNYVQKGVS